MMKAEGMWAVVRLSRRVRRKMEAGPESGRQWEVLVGEKSRELTGHPKSGREGTPHRHLLSVCCFGSQGLRFYCLLPVIQMCFFY